MPPTPTYIILACMSVYGLIVIVDLFRATHAKRNLIEALLLGAAATILHIGTGFPEVSRMQAFGGVGQPTLIGVMFASIVLGMAARYLFYMKGQFSWRAFLKPLCASPIVLFPLSVSVQGLSTLEPIQIASLCLVAFQNGFFWKVVFERARTEA